MKEQSPKPIHHLMLGWEMLTEAAAAAVVADGAVEKSAAEAVKRKVAAVAGKIVAAVVVKIVADVVMVVEKSAGQVQVAETENVKAAAAARTSSIRIESQTNRKQPCYKKSRLQTFCSGRQP